MDYKGASKYMLEKLEKSLPAYCYYHNLDHTLRVLDAVEILAAGESVTDPEILELLRIAAVYHDCGFLRQYQANESVAAEMASEALPGFGYSPTQIEFVKRMIMVTVLGAEPADVHERIIKDADFDYLGREGYWETSLKLKEEWSHVGMVYTMEDWISLQERFLSGHRFYTQTAIQLRDPVKQEHLRLIKAGHYGK